MKFATIVSNINFRIMACGTKKKKKMRQGGGVSCKIKKESAMKSKKRLGGGISPKLKKDK